MRSGNYYKIRRPHSYPQARYSRWPCSQGTPILLGNSKETKLNSFLSARVLIQPHCMYTADLDDTVRSRPGFFKRKNSDNLQNQPWTTFDQKNRTESKPHNNLLCCKKSKNPSFKTSWPGQQAEQPTTTNEEAVQRHQYQHYRPPAQHWSTTKQEKIIVKWRHAKPSVERGIGRSRWAIKSPATDLSSGGWM